MIACYLQLPMYRLTSSARLCVTFAQLFLISSLLTMSLFSDIVVWLSRWQHNLFLPRRKDGGGGSHTNSDHVSHLLQNIPFIAAKNEKKYILAQLPPLQGFYTEASLLSCVFKILGRGRTGTYRCAIVSRRGCWGRGFYSCSFSRCLSTVTELQSLKSRLGLDTSGIKPGAFLSRSRTPQLLHFPHFSVLKVKILEAD